MDWKKIGWGVLIINLIILDVGLGYLIYKSQIHSASSGQANDNTQITNTQTGDVCGADCQKYIDSKVAELGNTKAGVTNTPAPTPKTQTIYVKPPAAAKVVNVSYITVPGNGSSVTSDWTDLAGTEFYFNPADYPGLKQVYFEANIKLINGNGMAYVRLLDVTHGIGVQGSDTQTNSQLNTVTESGMVSFWAGKNLIRVQARSLTADTAIFNSGRLRIVTEN